MCVCLGDVSLVQAHQISARPGRLRKEQQSAEQQSAELGLGGSGDRELSVAAAAFLENFLLGLEQRKQGRGNSQGPWRRTAQGLNGVDL